MRFQLATGLCLLGLTGVSAWAQDSAPAVSASALSATMTFESSPEDDNLLEQEGTILHILLEGDQGVRLFQKRDNSHHDLLIRDSTGLPMKSIQSIFFSDDEKNPHLQIAILRMTALPSVGSKWISVKGYIPVFVFKTRVASEPFAFDTDSSIDFKAHNTPIHIENGEKGNLTVTYSLDAANPPFEFSFHDEQGNQVDLIESGGNTFRDIHSIIKVTRHFRKPEQQRLSITVTSWKDGKETNVPVQLKFDFYPSREDKTG